MEQQQKRDQVKTLARYLLRSPVEVDLQKATGGKSASASVCLLSKHCLPFLQGAC